MILAIDIGNTNIVLGCIEGREIVREARMATDLVKTSDQYCAELRSMLEMLEVDRKSFEGSTDTVDPVSSSRTSMGSFISRHFFSMSCAVRPTLRRLVI